MSDNPNGYKGSQEPNSSASKYNEHMFVILQALARVRTIQLVRVEAVSNAGGLAAVGHVDVLPLVNQLDGENQPVPHGTVYNIPYTRIQGGTNAVILDPQVGDIGICGFADRDISNVKTTKDIANPGSKRQFSMSDGLYLGGVLNGIPEQFIRFSSAGIEVLSPTKIRMVAPTIELEASGGVTIDTASLDISASSGVDIDTPNVAASVKVTAPLVVGTTDVTYAGHSAVTHIHLGGTIAGKTGPTV